MKHSQNQIGIETKKIKKSAKLSNFGKKNKFGNIIIVYSLSLLPNQHLQGSQTSKKCKQMFAFKSVHFGNVPV